MDDKSREDGPSPSPETLLTHLGRDTDAQFGVTRALIATYVRHEIGEEPVPAPDVTEPWYTLDYHFIVEPGEAWLPTPPVSAKSETQVAGQVEAAAAAKAAQAQAR